MQTPRYFIHESAYVDPPVHIGDGCKIWHFCHIQAGAQIGEGTSLGQNVNVSGGAKIGSYCRIQNNVSIYDGVVLEDYVFCGPSCVFTNDFTPRAEYPKGQEGYLPTLVQRGASIGANATLVCGCTIGPYALIAAGAVVTKDVEAHALMAGVPARKIGYVCACGSKLTKALTCPACHKAYQEGPHGLERIDSCNSSI